VGFSTVLVSLDATASDARMSRLVSLKYDGCTDIRVPLKLMQ